MLTIGDFLIGAFATYYLTAVLLFKHRTTPGLLEVSNVMVRLDTEVQLEDGLKESGSFYHKADFFDYLRWPFLYKQDLSDPEVLVWVVRNQRLGLWQCPTCLGFWLGLIVYVCLFQSWFTPLIVAFSFAGFGRLLYAIKPD